MISQTAEYALRVIVHLATQNGVPTTTHQLALVTRVPEGYLSKVLLGLSRAGMIHSQRGLHGGSVLTRPPEQISIHDVVESVDPIKRIRSCPLGLKSHGAALCPLHRRLDQAMAQVEQAFRDSTIADLLAEPTASKPLCEAPGTLGTPVQLTTVKSPSRKRSDGGGSSKRS